MSEEVDIPLVPTDLLPFLDQYGPWALFVMSFAVNVWLLRKLLASYVDRITENREQGRIVEANTSAMTTFKTVIETAIGRNGRGRAGR